MELLITLAQGVWSTFIEVVSYPIKPDERLYWMYLLTSIAFALSLYLWGSTRSKGATDGGALRFLFPAEVIKHRSTWVDVRYFIPHQLVRFWIYGAFGVAIASAVTTFTHSSATSVLGSPDAPVLHFSVGWMIAFTLVTSLLADFGAFLIHTLQHRVPFLWAFHKVHHSAEVLNPLSNYREHPVDNLLYAISHGILMGFCLGVGLYVFGEIPSLWTIWGVGIPMVMFNLLAYHLRHSHLWIRWPGFLAMVFGCPAHHQIHHSYEPEHLHKNMAFIYPIWDVLFGSFHLPKEKPHMTFGVGDGTEAQYSGFLRIYALPFKDLFSRKA